jgi:hypothetical protein
MNQNFGFTKLVLILTGKGVSTGKWSPAQSIVLAVCIFYSSFLSFQSDNDAFKKQLVNFAATLTGISVAIVACRAR